MIEGNDEILKHKSLNISSDEIVNTLKTGKIPEGIGIDMTEDTVSVSPLGECNLFGELTEDYELIYYEEKENDE